MRVPSLQLLQKLEHTDGEILERTRGMNVEARRSELGRRRPATTRRVDEGWVEPAGVDHHWLSGTASRKGPNPHRIVATCRRYELMAFNREVRWLWCGRQGEAWVGGLGGWGAVDWIPGILRRRRGVRGKQPPTSLHLAMPWHLSALRSKLSRADMGVVRMDSINLGLSVLRILLEAGSAGVLRSITAVSVQSLRLRLCGP